MFSSTIVRVALITLLSVNGALASLTIDTPTNVVQCTSIPIVWSKTTPPYNIVLVSSEDECGDVLQDIGDHNGTHIHYTLNQKAGTNVTLSIEDGTGDDAWSKSFTILPSPSNDGSCLLGYVPAQAAAALTPDATVAAVAAEQTTPATVGPVGAAGAGIVGNASGALSRAVSGPILALSALAAIYAVVC